MLKRTELTTTTAATPPSSLFVQRSPFVSAERLEVQLYEGMRLDEYVALAVAPFPAALRPHAEVLLGEHVVDRRYWHRIKPKAGTTITVRFRPHGKVGKSILRAVVMIAVVVAAAYFLGPGAAAAIGATGFAATLVTAFVVAVVAFATQLALNALIPPPDLSSSAGDSRPVLTGTVNQFQPYGPIPRVYGKTRVYPRLAAHPYSEISGNNQYLRILLCVGYGPIKVSDLRIGETPFADFQGAQYEVTEGGPDGWAGNTTLTLYTRQVREESLSVQMDVPGVSASHTTQPDTTEISIDIAFPSGLVTYTKKGDKEQRACAFKVEYSPTGTNAWVTANFKNDGNPETGAGGIITGRGASQDAIRISGRWTVAKGQYDVRITRQTAQGVQQAGGKTQIDNAAWVTLRSVVDETPVLEPGLCMIAIRLKATDQLNGVPREINCIAEAYLQEINDPNTWTLTRSPARAYCDVFRRRGRETLIPDARLDLAEMAAWETECAAAATNAAEPMWQFDGQMETGTLFSAARQIAACGRAAFTVRDGKFSVVRDKPQTVPVQHFTPKNSWGYRGTRIFIDMPHALRIRFANAEKGYADDEIIVYADGYTEETATKYDTLELYGITSATQAWREGRYHLAVGALRPEEHVISCDIENLRCTMGSLVRLSHDVILVGQTWGRITARGLDGSGNVVWIEVDEQCIFEAGKTYCARSRSTDDGASILLSCAPQSGAGTQAITNRLYIPATAAASAPDVNDLFMFGETGVESAPMIVKKIEPGPDLSAVVSLVSYDPAIYTADTGTIPPFTSYITQPIDVTKLAPEVPAISLRSNDSVTDVLSDGTTVYRLAVDIAASKSSPAVVDAWEVQFKESAADAWQQGPAAKATIKTVYIEPVRVGAIYDVRARAIGANGRQSAWVTITGHTIVGKTVAPELPVVVSQAAGYHSVENRWTNPQDLDLAYVEVLRNTTNNSTTATVVGKSATGLHVDQNLPIQLFYYWIRAVDRSGNASALVFVGSATPSNIIAYEQIGADNVLHPSEKLTIIREWAQIVDENTRLLTQADAYAIGTERDTYATAQSALASYLSGLTTPFAWNNMGGITTIARTTWNATWKAYYDARNALLNKIDDITAQISSQVSFIENGTPALSNIGNRIARKRGAATNWNFLAYTRENFSDACYMRMQFAPNLSSDSFIAGFTDTPTSSEPASNLAYQQVKYGFYHNAGALWYWEGTTGALLLAAGAWAPATDVFEIIYRNGTITYLRNGAAVRQVGTTAGRRFYGAVTTSQTISAVYGVQFREAASTATTLLNQGGIVITGNKAVKPNPPVAGTVDSSWDSAFITADQFVGGCTIGFTPDQNNAALMIGLNGDPTTDTSYTSLDYAIYCQADGQFRCYESSIATSIFGTYSAGDRFAVRYNKDAITYLKNGSVFRTVSTTAGRAFAGDSSFFNVGASASGIDFSAAGSDGNAGADGASIVELTIFKTSASAPTTPTGGSYNIGTRTLTPPAGWSSTPTGSPCYAARGAASGVGGVVTPTWTGVGLAFADGEGVDIVWKRSATQPSTPAPSAGVPTGWSGDVSTAPGTGPLWGSTGTRATATSNWTWDVAFKAEGADGISSLDVTTTAGSSVVVNCTSGGTPKAAIPGFTITVTQAGTDVSALATYSAPVVSNMTTVTGGGGVGANVIGVGGMSATSGYIELTITYGGATSKVRVTYNKINDPQPFVNGADTTFTAMSTTTTYVEVARVSLTMGPNGTVNADYTGNVRETAGSGSTVSSYMEISVNGGGFTQITSPGGASDVVLAGFDAGQVFGSYSGSGSALGIASSVPVVVRLMMRELGTGAVSYDPGCVLNASWSG